MAAQHANETSLTGEAPSGPARLPWGGGAHGPATLRSALDRAARELDAAASRIEGLPKRVRKGLPRELSPAYLRAEAQQARAVIVAPR